MLNKKVTLIIYAYCLKIWHHRKFHGQDASCEGQCVSLKTYCNANLTFMWYSCYNKQGAGVRTV